MCLLQASLQDASGMPRQQVSKMFNLHKNPLCSTPIYDPHTTCQEPIYNFPNSSKVPRPRSLNKPRKPSILTIAVLKAIAGAGMQARNCSRFYASALVQEVTGPFSLAGFFCDNGLSIMSCLQHSSTKTHMSLNVE